MTEWDFEELCEESITLRDRFAMAALTGLLAGPAGKPGVPRAEWFDLPSDAYALADCMIKQREQSNN